MESDGQAVRKLISADSHVIEPVEVWDGVLPDGYLGDSAATFAQRPGGSDPTARIGEMETDGVSAEVLYPSVAMQLFLLEDAALQQACFRRYNEWLAQYCSVAPDRLIGIGLIPAYDMDVALAEIEWCQANGLRGVQIWQTPPSHLSFSGSHHDPVWEACADLGLSVSLHILTGFDYSKTVYEHGPALVGKGELMFQLAINQKLLAIMDTLNAIILSGTLDWYRGLKLIVVENEVGWLPFFLDQLDYYAERYAGKSPISLERLPSVAFREQVGATFFRDPHAAAVAQFFDGGNIMWSSDYPHGNSTWPHSQQVVADRLGSLPEEMTQRLVWDTVTDLFDIALEPAR
jgi:predicted TIM-barrel fold metal-dependent hydrolase